MLKKDQLGHASSKGCYMDKLQYDDLYKFLVSLGMVLIILPIAALIYLFNAEPILISQVDFDLLSAFSLQMIANRGALVSYATAVFPWVAGALMSIGVGLLCCGVKQWIGVQKNLDKKLDAEATMQTLNLLRMSHEEIAAKMKEEASEATAIERPSGAGPLTDDAHSKMMNKYSEIEERCFGFFFKEYAKKYTFERNIRMGRFDYDFIGVSQLDNTDLIVEIKYFRAAINVKRLYDVFEHIHDAGVNYETIAHRNFKCIVIVVTPKEQLPRLEAIVEAYNNTHEESVGKLEIKCMTEEAL